MKTKTKTSRRWPYLFNLLGYMLFIGLTACAGGGENVAEPTAVPTQSPTALPEPTATEEIASVEPTATAVANPTAVPALPDVLSCDAARFPTLDTAYYIWGGNPAQADASLANFGKNSGDTTPVTALLSGANEAGLLNIHGNVWEWTADWFDENYYAGSPENNPTGPASGGGKVARGGSWSTNLEYISLTNRYTRNPNQGYDNVGFRCVRQTSP